MALDGWNRDLILANYQAASGNEDIETSISALEAHNWDLQTALNAHFVDQDNGGHNNQDGEIAGLESHQSGQAEGILQNRFEHIQQRSPSPIDVDQPSFVDLTPSDNQISNTEQPQSFRQFFLNSGFTNSGFPHSGFPSSAFASSTFSNQSGERTLRFQIIWQDKTFPISLAQTETVGTLKRMLEMQTGMDSNLVNLEGWPSGDSHVYENTVLSTLNLSDETHLVLHLPPKVTVSRAEHKPCNLPACRSPSRRRSISPESPPSIVDVEIEDKIDTTKEEITLNVNYEGRDYRLRYKPQQTVKVVKQELFLLTKIATRFQDWTGWPDTATDKSKLADLGLQPEHFLMMTSQLGAASSSSRLFNDADGTNPAKKTDSGMAGSPEDTDFEETVISDTDDSIFIDQDSTQSKRMTPLIPRDSSDSSESIIKLQCQFQERYGDFHPGFFLGPLRDALAEAAGQTVMERRPLLIYLHHDSSILANIFCSQILCSEQLVSYINQNFVIWPWDMSFESNRQRFVNMLVQHFGNTAANTISKFRDGQYPLLLIVMKSKAGLEVCSVLEANTSLDELMMALINGYEVFEQTKNIEFKAEQERSEREMMKQEQDAAYYESLAADRAKSEAETLKVQKEYEEQKQAHLDAQIKEAERISCFDQLPDEPAKTEKNITNILFRFPGGEREARRFRGDEKVKTIFMFVSSKGFNTEEHRVVTNFPRRQITEDLSNKTLKECNLCPQETLFVEEKDRKSVV